MYRFHGQIRTTVKHSSLVSACWQNNRKTHSGWMARYSIKTSNISTFQCSVLGVIATKDLTGNMSNTTVLIFILQKSCNKKYSKKTSCFSHSILHSRSVVNPFFQEKQIHFSSYINPFLRHHLDVLFLFQDG